MHTSFTDRWACDCVERVRERAWPRARWTPSIAGGRGRLRDPGRDPCRLLQLRQVESRCPALKCVYMAVMSLDPTGQGRKRWTMRWKPALQAFDIAFDGRLSVGRH